MDHEKFPDPVLTPEQEKSVKSHQTNLISYSVTTLFGILMMTVLIPTFVKLKKNADFGPERFPYIVAGIFIVLGAIGLILECCSIRKEGLKIPFPKIHLTRYIPQAVMVAVGFLFIFLASVLGFLPSSILFMAGMLFLFGSRNWKFNLVFAFVYGILIFALFSKVLGIRFVGGLISL